MNQLQPPETKGQEVALQKIVSNIVTVTDSSTHDLGISLVTAAETLVKGVKSIFKPVEDAIKAQKERLITPASEFIKEQRSRCLAWQLDQDAAKKPDSPEFDPFAETEAPMAASTRYKAWEVRVSNEDKLWNAAVENPSLRKYWTPDLKALTDKVRQMDGMIEIPGVDNIREKTLVKKRGM